MRLDPLQRRVPPSGRSRIPSRKDCHHAGEVPCIAADLARRPVLRVVLGYCWVMSARQVVKLRKSALWVTFLVALDWPLYVGLIVLARNLTLGATLVAVGLIGLSLLPVVRVVGGDLVMTIGPLKRRISLTDIDAFVHLISGKYEGLGYSPASTFEVKAIWGSRFASRPDRNNWLTTLRGELKRARPAIPPVDQRAATAGVPRREMKAVTVSSNRVTQRVLLYDSDVTVGDRPRYTCMLPLEIPTAAGSVIEMFGNTVEGNVVLRLPHGLEAWPVQPLSPPPFRGHPWAMG